VKYTELFDFAHDAKRFALKNRSVVEEVPLQLYSSAIMFAPERSMVRKKNENQIPRWIGRLPKVHKEWSSLLQTLEGHTESV